MDTFNLQSAQYYVSGLQGFTLTEALRLWKAKFETIKHFHRDVANHPSLEELGNFVAENWESIIPISVQEALSEQNTEKRRVMFDCIGVAKLFAQLAPELLDRQVISKKRMRWDQDNKRKEHHFNDVYELYHIESEKLFGEPPSGPRQQSAVFAVRCWCTTTAREYWIYVPEEVATGRTRWSSQPENPDAVRAIAWTIRIDITDPARIFRQGDIIVAEESESSVQTEPYHLNKKQYLNLLYSET